MNNKIIVRAELLVRHDNYYMRFRYTPEKGAERKELTRSTGLSATPGNKVNATQMLWTMQKQIEKEVNYNYVPLRQDVPFHKFMKLWIEEIHKTKEVEQNTWEGYERNVRRHIIPYFEKKAYRLSDIRIRHLEEFYVYLEYNKGLSANTVHKVHICINGAFKFAIRREILYNNPAQYVKLSKIERYQAETLTLQQWKTLSNLFKGDIIEIPVMITAFCGLRRSEVLALEWKDYNQDTGMLNITKTRIVVKGGIEDRNKCKNRTSSRKIYLPEPINDLLKSWKAKQEENKVFFGNSYISMINDKPNDFICTWENGKPIDPNYISHRFHYVLSKSELPHIRFHDLRHTVATLLAENGTSLQDIKDLLGHSSITTTSNIYINFSSTSAKKTAETTTLIFRD